MKEGKCLITFVLLAMVMPAEGAERSMPGTAPPKPPSIQQQTISPSRQKAVTPVKLPDLVVTSLITLGGAYPIGQRNGYVEEAVGVEIAIMNKGLVATGRPGSDFAIGVHHDPQCVLNCSPVPSLQQPGDCAVFAATATKFFHFSPPINVNTPLVAGETRTIRATLVLPQCLQRFNDGKASVYVIVDGTRSQIEESDESNNKSTVFSVESKIDGNITLPGPPGLPNPPGPL